MTSPLPRSPLLPQLPPTLPTGTRLYASTAWWTNTNTLEFYVAAMALVWGVWVLGWWLIAGNVMAGIPAFQLMMGHVLPAWMWGGISTILGLGHLLTCMRTVRLRMLWLFLAMMWWGAVGFMVVIAVPYSAAVVMYGGMCIVVAICYLRLSIVHDELFTLTWLVRPMVSLLTQRWRVR